MLKVFNEFERRPDLLAKFDEVLTAYSATAIFADVQYRTGVMDSGIKPPFRAKVCGQAVTVQLSKGDLVDPLKALEMGQPGDIIVVDAGVCRDDDDDDARADVTRRRRVVRVVRATTARWRGRSGLSWS